MLSCRVAMRLDAGDFRLERLDPGCKLIDRERAEVLLAELGQRILGLVGKEVVEIHHRNVGRARRSVNRLWIDPALPRPGRNRVRRLARGWPRAALRVSFRVRRCDSWGEPCPPQSEATPYVCKCR